MAKINRRELYQAHREGMTFSQIADKFNLTRGQVSSYIRTYKKNPVRYEEEQTSEPVFDDKKIQEDVNWREIIDNAVAVQEVDEKTGITQRTATIKLPVKKPVAITFSGDWHLGCSTVDYDTWKNDIEYIIDTKNLYLFVLGDVIQNMRAFKSLIGVLSQVIPVNQQPLIIKSLADELKHKTLGWVTGNHDYEFDERIFGQAALNYIMNNIGCPLFPNKGLVKLYVGETLYTILVFHKSRFKSFLRETHGNMREQQLTYPADIIAGAHDHAPGYEMRPYYMMAQEAGMGFGGLSYLIKVGTYQDNDYGYKYFHNGGFPLNPTVVLFPNTKKMEIFTCPQDAMSYINGL